MKTRNASNFFARTMAILLAVLLVMGATPAGAARVFADDASQITVSTWEGLESAVSEAKDGDTITISGVLAAGNTIEINKNITLVGDGATIYQLEKDSYNTMFSVTGGKLTLGRGVTLSGKTVSCTTKTLTLDECKKTTSTGKFTIKSGDNYLYIMGDNSLVSTANSAAATAEGGKFTLSTSGELLSNGMGVGAWGTMYGRKNDQNTPMTVYAAEDTSTPVTEISDGEYLLKIDEKWFTIGAKSAQGFFDKLDQPESATKWTIEVETTTVWTVDGTEYTDQTEAESALENSPNKTSQVCDFDNANDHVYTKDEFEGNKGFFVNVTGGELLLNGATLTDFKTTNDESKENNPTPVWTAPVVVDGGTFTMTDGEITGNEVGYTISNDQRNGNNFTSGNVKNTKKWIAGLPLNNCAGAVIFKNGATGDINGGSISDNKGASGALIVTGSGTTVNLKKGAKINENVGLLFAGAALVEHGATLNMYEGAEMNNNVTWHRGGAVWATEWGTNGFVKKDWSTKPPVITNPGVRGTAGTFNMYGGTLDGNTALVRGGAINVESNAVHLFGGTISNNKCYSLGGGIYVEGDSEDYTYVLHIPEGYIGENKAVLDNDKLNGQYDSDFNGAFGNGGGVWLCPIGGTGALSINENDDVVINNNTAVNPGQDVYLISGNGSLIVSDLGSYEWTNENNNSTVQKGKNYSGPLPLTNQAGEGVKNSAGIQIINNQARDGGGIAANGTVIFGYPEDIWKQEASISFTKKWSHQLNPTEAKFSVKYNDGKKDHVIYEEITLDGKADYSENESAGAVEQESADAYEWNASIDIPVTYTDENGAAQALFLFVDPADPSKTIDPSTNGGIRKLGGLSSDQLKVADGSWKIIIEELNTNSEFVITSDDITVESFSVNPNAAETTTTYGGKEFTVSVNYTTVQFGQTISNDTENEIEKYVNKAVHQDIKIDDVFTYDILAYVPMDADKVVITDELVEDLEFVSADADVEVEVEVVVLYGANNHQPANNIAGEAINDEATVSQAGEKVDGAEVKIVNGEKNKKLVVTIENELEKVTEGTGYKNAKENQNVTPLRGRWIKVTFQAQVKKALQDEIKAGRKTIEDLKNVKIKADENKPVESEEAHDGIDNTAKIEVEVKNEHNEKYDKTSNTVTVKPEKPEEPDTPPTPPETPDEPETPPTPPETPDEPETPPTPPETPDEPETPPTPPETPDEPETPPTPPETPDEPETPPTPPETPDEPETPPTPPETPDEPETPPTPPETPEYPVEISKTDMTEGNGKEVPGAEIELKDKDGNIIDKWTSSEDGPHKVNLKPGEYTLKEVNAPEGFQAITTIIKFSVDENGKVTLLNAEEVSEDEGAVKLLTGDTVEHIVIEDMPKPTVPDVPETPRNDNPPPQVPSTGQPEKPTTPTPSVPNVPTTGAPPTGDSNNMMIWVVIGLVAALMAATAVRLRIKK